MTTNGPICSTASNEPNAMHRLNRIESNRIALLALPPLKPHTIRFGWCYSAVRRVRDDDEREKNVSPPRAASSQLISLLQTIEGVMNRDLNNNTQSVKASNHVPTTEHLSGMEACLRWAFRSCIQGTALGMGRMTHSTVLRSGLRVPPKFFGT